jgi:hypothetical protein
LIYDFELAGELVSKREEEEEERDLIKRRRRRAGRLYHKSQRVLV